MVLTPITDYFRIEKLQQHLEATMTCQAHIKKVRHVISWKSGEIDADLISFLNPCSDLNFRHEIIFHFIID